MNEKPLQPWYISAADGTILCAHCTCMAGLGEVCTHVGALAFAVDAFNTLAEKTTCTGRLAEWKVPTGVKGVSPLPGYQINMASAKARKISVDKLLQDPHAVAPPSIAKQKALFPVPKPTEGELSNLFRGLNMCGANKPTVLKVLPEYSREFKVPDIPENLNLTRLFDVNCVGKSLSELQEHCRNINLSISVEESDHLEEATRKQSDSHVWFAARAGRVTASKFHSVCHSRIENPSISLVGEICKPAEHRFSSVYTEWGLCNEEKARQAYIHAVQDKHSNFTLKPSGFHVPPEYPFMGATPDGIVQCECHGRGCVEIKCPFTKSHVSVNDAACDDKFCLQKRETGEFYLNPSHPYYCQVQAQLFLTKSAYCDFVVWTTVDMEVVRVLPDGLFWDEHCEKAVRFFKLAILPELVGNWTSLKKKASKRSLRGKEVQEEEEGEQEEDMALSEDEEEEENDGMEYCVCGESEFGMMVKCDNDQCAMQWFHFSCVGLKDEPEGDWFCPDCSKSRCRTKSLISTSKKQKKSS